MGRAIFLTGSPGSGKTTVIQKVLTQLPREASGFITQEIREGGKRKGFKIVTLDGDEGILAHIDRCGSPRIGKYGVNPEALETLGVNSLRRAREMGTLAVVDEIGPMEILSENFRRILIELLNGDVEILGTIVKRSLPYTDKIKAFPNVTILEIHRGNRNGMVDYLLELLEEA
jgi:nucleoside-triphosphatase